MEYGWPAEVYAPDSATPVRLRDDRAWSKRSGPPANILNLRPPPQKILRIIGEDTTDLGAPCHTQFQRFDGRVRADVHLPPKTSRRNIAGALRASDVEWLGDEQKLASTAQADRSRLTHVNE
jgi:hypothetical protein